MSSRQIGGDELSLLMETEAVVRMMVAVDMARLGWARLCSVDGMMAALVA